MARPDLHPFVSASVPIDSPPFLCTSRAELSRRGHSHEVTVLVSDRANARRRWLGQNVRAKWTDCRMNRPGMRSVPRYADEPASNSARPGDWRRRNRVQQARQR